MLRRIVLGLFAILLAASLVSSSAAVSREPRKGAAGASPAARAAAARDLVPAACDKELYAVQWAAAADTNSQTPSPTETPEPTPEPTETPESTPEPPAFDTPSPGKAVIIFTFDDGPLSDYVLAYPILKQYGIKGTSYIITKFTDAGTKGKLTWENIKEMAEYGWVFGAHTNGHNDMKGLSAKRIKADCEAVNQSFINQGLDAPKIMSYPYGLYNKRVIKAIKPYYGQARLAYYRNYFVDVNGDPYKIACISADMRTKSELKKAKKLVDKACRKGAVIVFRVHTLYKNKPYDTVKRNTRILSGCAPQTSSKLFAKLVKYCADKGCGFMTMEELMEYMEGQAE